MKYLHSSDIECHGLLRSGNCLIDGRWILKISDFGIVELNRLLKIKPYPKRLIDFLFLAPEHMRRGYRQAMTTASPAGDVYSFAIIAAEVISRTRVDKLLDNDIEIEKAIQKIRYKPRQLFRPMINKPDDVPANAVKLVQRCWSEQPIERPTFRTIFESLKKFVEKG